MTTQPDFFGGTYTSTADNVKAPYDVDPAVVAQLGQAQNAYTNTNAARTTGTINAQQSAQPTPSIGYNPDAQLAAYDMGNIGGASGAYNAASPTGQQNYDLMHTEGSGSTFGPLTTPSGFLSNLGSQATGYPLSVNPVLSPASPNGLVNNLGNAVGVPGVGDKTFQVASPGAAASSIAQGVGMPSGASVNNVMGINTGSGSGGTGGTGGTTAPAGVLPGGGSPNAAGTDLNSNLLNASLDLNPNDPNSVKGIQQRMMAGEFAPPSSGRDAQTAALGAANAFAQTGGPGTGSFLNQAAPLPGSPAASTLVTGGGVRGGMVPPTSGAGANPAQSSLTVPGGQSLLGSAANTGRTGPTMVPGPNPNGVTQMPVTPSGTQPLGGQPLGQPAAAPGAPASGPASSPSYDPTRVTAAARQDYGSFLQNGSATQPWQGQIQTFANQAQGPSAAQAQLTQGRDQAMNDALSLARSGRGGAGDQARALRGAIAQNAATNVQTGAQAATLRAQEDQAYRNQKLSALGLGAGTASSQDSATLAALQGSGNLATSYDANTLGGLTLGSQTATNMRGLDINQSGQTTQNILDSEKIAAGETGQILGASTSQYATDAGIANQDRFGPGDLQYWTNKI